MAIFNSYVTLPEGSSGLLDIPLGACNGWNTGWISEKWLVGGDWNHGMDYDFPFSWECKIIPTDEFSIIFQRGWLKPPIR